jgi:hypothetical protein
MAPAAGESFLMLAPAEIRGLIYEYLFDNGCDRKILIKNESACHRNRTDRIRTTYTVFDRSPFGRCYQTTYQLASKEAYFCAAIMRANRQLYHETACLLYAKHTFDFGSDIEAVAPFLSDLRPCSRRMVTELSVYKCAPFSLYFNEHSEWRAMCKYLQEHGAVKKLRLVVQGGKPGGGAAGAPPPRLRTARRDPASKSRLGRRAVPSRQYRGHRDSVRRSLLPAAYQHRYDLICCVFSKH